MPFLIFADETGEMYVAVDFEHRCLSPKLVFLLTGSRDDQPGLGKFPEGKGERLQNHVDPLVPLQPTEIEEGGQDRPFWYRTGAEELEVYAGMDYVDLASIKAALDEILARAA